MAKEKVEFAEFKKSCKYRTYQDQKCVNEKNKEYRKIGSCKEELCPLKGKPETAESAPAATTSPEDGK